MDKAWIKKRIDRLKLRIETLETASDDLASGTIISYTMDSGQSRQTVTKKDIHVLESTIASLYGRLDTLESRLNGGCVQVIPGW